jgi:hypothetical protein
MQFLMFDFALAFAALLGHRALVAVWRRRAAVVSIGAGMPVVPTQAPGSVLARLRVHRLINFW